MTSSDIYLSVVAVCVTVAFCWAQWMKHRGGGEE